MTAVADSLELPNRLDHLDRLGPFVEQFAARSGVPEAVAGAFRLALEEMVSNVVRHGYSDDRPHIIHVRLTREGATVAAVVEDDGRPFDPLSRPVPAIDRPIHERGIGGLGVWLTRNAVDEMEYRREGDKNVLFLRKRIQPE